MCFCRQPGSHPDISLVSPSGWGDPALENAKSSSATTSSIAGLAAGLLSIGLLSIGLLGIGLLGAEVSIAQIAPDATLPNRSVVDTTGSTRRITGGTRSGRHLFHSFREFSVPTGSTARFDNAADVENIFTRVTGRSVSNIDGLLGANGSANLFLLNPNGIMFGPNARLQIGGSFVGSTASAIRFQDGFEFASTDTTTPLLTVSAPVGLRIGSNSGPIQVNNAPSNGLPDLTNLGLQVQPGRSLALIGGDIELNGGRINVFGGRVELAGLAEAGTVGLSELFTTTLPSGITRANVSLRNGALIYATAPAPLTSLVIQAQNISLSERSTLLTAVSSTTPVPVAGPINLNASAGLIIDNSNVYAAISPGAIGTTSNIHLTANQFLITGSGQIATSVLGQGQSGDVNLTADKITVDGTGSRLAEGIATGIYSILTDGSGQAGNVNVNTRNIAVVNGGVISASTFDRGDGGDVNIQATDTVTVEGVTPGAVGIGSIIGSTVEDRGIGNGGNVNITAPTLRLSRGGVVAGRALGQGNGGSINLVLDRLEAESQPQGRGSATRAVLTW
jgi:filamentous hemagglutinin family protein